MRDTITTLRTDYEKFESYLINMTDWSVIFINGGGKAPS
jgi:hypothetical protein